jgi:hypothetical protein
MEVLSDILRAVKLTGAVFLDAEFREPWNIAARGVMARLLMPEAGHFIHYHYIVEGRCRAQVDGETALDLQAGEVVVFPLGDPHVLGSHLHPAAFPLSKMLFPPQQGGVAVIQYGGNGGSTRIVCGFLACDRYLSSPILTALPRAFRVNLRACASEGWLESSIRQAVAAAASRQAGADVVLARLSEALFVETLRQYIEGMDEEQKGWLAGLRDPFVANALKLIHRSPAQSWTVEELARSVGCSRSVIAERFAHYLGTARGQRKAPGGQILDGRLPARRWTVPGTGSRRGRT